MESEYNILYIAPENTCYLGCLSEILRISGKKMDITPFFWLAASLYFYVEAGQADLKTLKNGKAMGKKMHMSTQGVFR